MIVFIHCLCLSLRKSIKYPLFVTDACSFTTAFILFVTNALVNKMAPIKIISNERNSYCLFMIGIVYSFSLISNMTVN